MRDPINTITWWWSCPGARALGRGSGSRCRRGPSSPVGRSGSRSAARAPASRPAGGRAAAGVARPVGVMCRWPCSTRCRIEFVGPCAWSGPNRVERRRRMRVALAASPAPLASAAAPGGPSAGPARRPHCSTRQSVRPSRPPAQHPSGRPRPRRCRGLAAPPRLITPCARRIPPRAHERASTWGLPPVHTRSHVVPPRSTTAVPAGGSRSPPSGGLGPVSRSPVPDRSSVTRCSRLPGSNAGAGRASCA